MIGSPFLLQGKGLKVFVFDFEDLHSGSILRHLIDIDHMDMMKVPIVMIELEYLTIWS